MAQEIRIERRERRERPAGRRPAMREPQSTEEARLAIEETRGRISATLDEIEGRIDETREQIKDKVDVTRPVRGQIRAHPLPGLAAAFGGGLVLGLLTGGGDEERERRRRRREMLDEEERQDLRRWRAERRERLRDRLGSPRGERSLTGQIAGAVLSAAMAGLVARGRRMISGASKSGRP